jgi:hypothetical protein
MTWANSFLYLLSLLNFIHSDQGTAMFHEAMNTTWWKAAVVKFHAAHGHAGREQTLRVY